VLRDLMDHRSLSTTLGYYRVGEARKRAAMELLGLAAPSSAKTTISITAA